MLRRQHSKRLKRRERRRNQRMMMPPVLMWKIMKTMMLMRQKMMLILKPNQKQTKTAPAPKKMKSTRERMSCRKEVCASVGLKSRLGSSGPKDVFCFFLFWVNGKSTILSILI
uniref:Uncharacterized protein n=3 Tax=Rhizophora mucronata TaxID=61149 RepID=A0A2P2JB50_RHIMU